MADTREIVGERNHLSIREVTRQRVSQKMKIFEGESFYNGESIEILNKTMLIQDNEKKIYGKTGSGSNGEAWFIGFTEKGQQKLYFAIYLNDSSQREQISSSDAKEVALKIIDNALIK